MDGKFIAYYRVSTDHQGVNGNGIAAQRKAVEDYLNGGRWQLMGEFTEVESGKRSDRPQLEKAMVARGRGARASHRTDLRRTGRHVGPCGSRRVERASNRDAPAATCRVASRAERFAEYEIWKGTQK
jgi:Resolvase, N terminal domain